MKKFLALLVLLQHVPAYAKTCVWDESKTNPDNTVTLKNPRLVRGNQSYLFNAQNSNSMQGICRAAGFNNFLEQSMFYTANYSSYEYYKATVNSDGNFSSLSGSPSYTVTEITCYNGDYATVVVSSSAIQNIDSTVTLKNPKLVRGNQSYFFNAQNSNSMQGICHGAGFENFLEQSMLYTANYSSYEYSKATVRYDGSFSSLSGNPSYTVTEITCYSGNYSSVVQNSNGSYYFQR